MQKEVLTITAECKITEALSLMDKHNLHRLPVVSGRRLIGLVTEGIISAHTPSKATSLSIHEMNYLLSKMSADDIMLKDVVTVYPDTLLEDAANIMRHNDIGCLPVIKDEGMELVGIITINDIVDAFIDMIGLTSKGVRLEIEVKDHVGVLADITSIFAAQNINLSRVSVFQELNNYVIIVLTTTTNIKKVEKDLSERGYEVRAKHVYE